MSMADFLFICIWLVVCKGHRKINDTKLNIQVTAQVKECINFSFASAKLQMKKKYFCHDSKSAGLTQVANRGCSIRIPRECAEERYNILFQNRPVSFLFAWKDLVLFIFLFHGFPFQNYHSLMRIVHGSLVSSLIQSISEKAIWRTGAQAATAILTR